MLGVFWGGVCANLGAVHISETLNKDTGRKETSLSPSASMGGQYGHSQTQMA